MTEPTLPTAGVGIVTVAVALLGPMAGPYAVIVLSALAGALWALSAQATPNRIAGGLLVARLVLTAVVLAGGVAWIIDSQYHWPAHQTLAPVAFAIGMGGDRWRSLVDVVVGLVSKRVGGGQ
jgi:hypothetical protein